MKAEESQYEVALRPSLPMDNKLHKQDNLDGKLTPDINMNM